MIVRKAIALFLSVILTMACICSLAGCSPKDNAIVIWAYDYYIDAAKEAVAIYQSEHPDQKFEVVELGQDDMVQKFNIALASGDKSNLPDIICDEDYNIKGYLEFYQKYFTDLTPYVDTSKYVDFKVKDVTYDGKLYGIPYDTGVAAWFYRADIMEEAGFTASDLENITWDRFIEIGKIVKEKTGKYMMPTLFEGNIEGRIILQSSGSWYYDEEGNLDILENKAIIDMMSTLKKLHDSGVVALASSWDDIIAKFYSGEAAGVIGGSWWAPVIAANEDHYGLWRVAPIPTMTGSSEYKNYSSCGGCSWYVINNDNSKAAIDFLTDTIAVSDEIADKLVASNQVVPALKTAFSVPSATAGDPYFGGQNICEIMAKWGEDVPYVNYSSHSYEIAYAHGNLFTDFLAGNTTAEEIVNELQVEAEAIVSGSN